MPHSLREVEGRPRTGCGCLLTGELENGTELSSRRNQQETKVIVIEKNIEKYRKEKGCGGEGRGNKGRTWLGKNPWALFCRGLDDFNDLFWPRYRKFVKRTSGATGTRAKTVAALLGVP